jgi:A/G-specific adenine glycosylase
VKTSIVGFYELVMGFHRAYGRHDLPWRTTRDPYAILVSEIMLQQTQVDRVVPHFGRWMKRFPTPSALAAASLTDVLKEWQGLGYNRRAKLLRECAKAIVEKHRGKVPKDREGLLALPAIGPYTAGAIRAFAFDESEVFIETNIRAALLHHFFPRSKNVPDTKLMPILRKLILHAESPREWYAAFMDYGSHIKKANPNPSRRSKHHTAQSRFEGSQRQLRGHLLRRLMDGPIAESALVREQTKSTYRIEQVLRAMEAEGLLIRKGKSWRLAD